MDERIAVWNVLHDGEITAASQTSEALALFVNIPYLRRRFEPIGDSFVLTLSGVTEIGFRSFDGKPETLAEQLQGGRPEILSTESEGMPVVIDTTMGQLTLAFEHIEIALDTGATVTIGALDKAAAAYWNEWEQKAAKARDQSA
jgi:hypothetical protein